MSRRLRLASFSVVGATLASLALGAIGRRAHADTPTGAGTLTFDQRFYNDARMDFEKINPDQIFFHMNRATCLCAEKFPTDPHFQIGVFEQLSGDGLSTSAMETWVGSSCDQSTARQPPPGGATCEKVTSAGLAHYNDISIRRGFLAQIPTDRFIEPYKTGCQAAAGSNTLYDLLINGASVDVAGSQAYSYDTQAPELPTNFEAIGGENAIQINFTPPADTSDILYYQALCSTVDGAPALSKAQDAHYDVTRFKDHCNLMQNDVTLVPSDATGTAVVADAQPADAAMLPDGTPDAQIFDARPDAMPTASDLPAPLAELDPSFVCGTISSGNSMRITGLTNYTPYRVVLLAIDKYGNAAGTYLTQVVTPKPVTDFWEDLHDEGSQVQSGFCLISDTYGDGGPITRAMRAFRDDTLGASAAGRAFTRFYYAHVAWLGEYARAHWPVRVVLAIVLLPLVLIALAWHVLTLPGLLALVGIAWWLRRRRRGRSARLALAGTVAAIALSFGAGAAHAQPDAYWTADDDETPDLGPAEPNWVVGIKLGPFLPGIDAQFHAQTGATYKSYYPYRHMFGGYNIMPVIEVDRVLFRDFGQVTIGGSFGYLGKTGQAYEDATSYTDPTRPRSDGDSNAFRMVPLTLEAGYRFTYLDDQWGIPFVPYLKGGLAYTVWWMRDPNGGFSHIGSDNCHPQATPCMQTAQRAVGGSMGLVGSVGLSIRAERIDPDAAASMREGGVQHAGFYAELQASWVDSFGNANRLSVGDQTWFAGFDFEF